MPLSDKYSAHVLVASGHLNEPYSKRYTRNLRAQSAQNVDNSGSLLLDLYQLAEYIYNDKFWRAQIEHIYVLNNEFEMVPRVGTHIIEFGGIDNFEKKFRNLKALYLKGLPETGWNNYNTVNLKYNNQVICTKR
jgi:cell division protein FtsQ